MIFQTLPSGYTLDQQFSLSMNVLIMLGFGALLGTFLIGNVKDRYGHKVTTFMNLIILILTSVTLFIFLRSKEYNSEVYLMVFCWGTLDACISTHTYSTIGKEFDNSPAGYATYNLF
jgi:predicted MFS family arabinose efflux permease